MGDLLHIFFTLEAQAPKEKKLKYWQNALQASKLLLTESSCIIV
jgi:hypothetical protein